MGKRKMKFIPNPEELVQEMQSNKRSRLTTIKVVRDQCLGSQPKKEAFISSDVLPVLIAILEEARARGQVLEYDDEAATSLDILTSLIRAEPSTLPHAKEFKALVPLLYTLLLYSSPSNHKPSLRALLELCKKAQAAFKGSDDGARHLAEEIQSQFGAKEIVCLRAYLEDGGALEKLVLQLACHLPRTENTSIALGNQILSYVHLALCGNENPDEETLAAYCSLLPLIPEEESSRFRLVTRFGMLSPEEVLLKRLKTSRNVQCRLDCAEILFQILRDADSESEARLNQICKTNLRMDCLDQLVRMLKSDAAKEPRAARLLKAFVGLHDSNLETLIDGGILKALLSQAQLLFCNGKAEAARFALDAARCFGSEAILQDMTVSATSPSGMTTVVPSWKELLGFLSAGVQHSDEAVRTSILLFWTSLTAKVESLVTFSEYFEGIHLCCLNVAKRGGSLKLRLAALKLFSNLAAGLNLPQGQSAKKIQALREESLKTLTGLLDGCDLDDIGNSAAFASSLLRAMQNLFLWDEWPKLQDFRLWGPSPAVLTKLMQSGIKGIQENMAYLILNLSAGSSSDDLALWIGYDALADFCSCLWRDLKHKLTELDIVVGNALHKAQAKQALMSSHAFGTLLFALANLISQGSVSQFRKIMEFDDMPRMLGYNVSCMWEESCPTPSHHVAFLGSISSKLKDTDFSNYTVSEVDMEHVHSLLEYTKAGVNSAGRLHKKTIKAVLRIVGHGKIYLDRVD